MTNEEMKDIIRNLPSEKFAELLISLDEFDFWVGGFDYGVDGIHNIGDRMDVIDTFEEGEVEMYYDKLKELNFI